MSTESRHGEDHPEVVLSDLCANGSCSRCPGQFYAYETALREQCGHHCHSKAEPAGWVEHADGSGGGRSHQVGARCFEPGCNKEGVVMEIAGPVEHGPSGHGLIPGEWSSVCRLWSAQAARLSGGWTMMSYGSREFLLSEARTGPRIFACPTCTAKVGESCRRTKGYQQVGTHRARIQLWDAYCREAPTQLAWLQQMALPWFELAIQDYLAGGKRPQRRKTDIQIALRRIDEAHQVLRQVPS